MEDANNKYTVIAGWLTNARRVPSDNFEPRPSGFQPELLVIHNISLPPGQFGGDCIERFFCNCLDWDEHPFFEEIRDVKVSSHLLIQRGGEVVQFVSFDDRAWHAGVSQYQGRDNCNDFSIGIELEGTDELPYTDLQYQSLQAISRALFATYPGLCVQRVAGHCDIAPGRKTDPGPAFDWQHYLQPLTVNDKKEFGA